MAETFDLVGKKKKVLDEGLYFSAPRDESNDTIGTVLQQGVTIITPLAPSKLSSAVSTEILNADYFSSPEKVDKVKVILGNNWDYRVKNQNWWDPATKIATFGNTWNSPAVFDGFPIYLEMCTPSPTEPSQGYEDGVTREKIVLSCDIDLSKSSTWPEDDLMLKSWLYYTKTGLIAQGTAHNPIINSDNFFVDHYHETFMPFSPEELMSKLPAGKAFFANYSTYYNERLQTSALEADRSVDDQGVARLGYENFLGSLISVNKSIPSIYGFLRLMSAKDSALSEYFDLSKLDVLGLENTGLSFNNDPLEYMISIFGFLSRYRPDLYDYKASSAIIGKIVGSNYKNIDAHALFEEYFDAWTDRASTEPQGLIDFAFRNKLEKKFSNLVFSPNILPIMDTIEKHKKYFPFYSQIEFSAKLSSPIGDFIKQAALARPLSAIAASVRNPVVLGSNTSTVYELSTNERWSSLRFWEYAEENIYENLTPDPITGLPPIELTENTLAPPQHKPYLADFPDILNKWVKDEEDIFAPNSDGETIFDFTAFLRNDFIEPANLDDECNVVWKKIFGTAFYKKIIDTYKQKRRSYSDLLAGKPAYTEDLFYRIQKSVRHTGESVFRPVQSILIPNTSDLDIVKFVDTQLKYSDDAVYKYDVYAQRIVFGSRYRYQWVDEDGSPAERQTAYFLNEGNMEAQVAAELAWLSPGEAPENWVGISQGVPEIENTTQDEDGNWTGQYSKYSLHATLGVFVYPSVVLLEDKIFSTPEIMIMDKPPVTPDVNIVPYRAINNRVKMLITANVDRYRAEPIILLDEDVSEFEKVQAAQLSYDGKVEFGSDDPVNRFQIFKTTEKPKSYSNFELYKDINNTVFEESILPNTKYYYTFRAVDTHSHVSNPTPVYEVELIDEKGAVKPIIRTISMEGAKNTTHVKDCQKYIYLKPTLQQLYFSDNSEIDGVFSDATKKKKYKMRLTSKGSGKKIDINFSFRKKTQN